MKRQNPYPALLVAFAAFLAVPAASRPVQATQADISPAFGNTIVSTHPDGRKARLWINVDHTYSAQSRAGRRSGGTWKVKGAKLCLSQTSPYPGLFSYCKVARPIAIGKPWSDTAVTGEQVTNEVFKGQQ